MRAFVLSLLMLGCLSPNGFAGEQKSGLRGDPAAIAQAEAMVETMGGMELWARMKSLHFVHRWYPVTPAESYVEEEILDLTGSRSYVERKNEVYHRLRVYSPEWKRWSVTNGEFSFDKDEIFQSAMKRAPFNFYRLVHAVAVGDPFYEVRFGAGDIPQTQQLEFYGPDGVKRGWVILNARNEPRVKATTDYRYTFGPMKRFGNLRVPAWGVYDNGYTLYEMISLTASDEAPDSSLFIPPSEFRARG